MKYIRYILILTWAIISKVIGLIMFWVALPFRKYARNVVYNYALQNPNKFYLKRLEERPIDKLSTFEFKGKLVYGYRIHPYHETKDGGYIGYRYICDIEFLVVFWLLWGWLDDDSNYDTCDKGFIQSIVNRERWTIFPKGVISTLESYEWRQYGNTFDLGDYRQKEFYLLGSTLWLIRNTAYNFNYALQECRVESKNWWYKRLTTRWFDWHFGFLPEGKHDRAGRMVWFTEDIKYSPSKS